MVWCIETNTASLTVYVTPLVEKHPVRYNQYTVDFTMVPCNPKAIIRTVCPISRLAFGLAVIGSHLDTVLTEYEYSQKPSLCVS